VDLDADPVATLERAYGRLGLTLGDEGRSRMQGWATGHRRGSHGTHQYALTDFGLDAAAVEDRFRPYIERFGPSNVLR